MEQDPTFAFRIIVDIASKALSPANNGPTTVAPALERIRQLLRHVGSRRIDDERVRASTSRVSLMYRMPDWRDFVTLAVTEIRHFGGPSILIPRRLRGVLEEQVEAFPEQRAKPLRQELKLLKSSTGRFFSRCGGPSPDRCERFAGGGWNAGTRPVASLRSPQP